MQCPTEVDNPQQRCLPYVLGTVAVRRNRASLVEHHDRFVTSRLEEWQKRSQYGSGIFNLRTMPSIGNFDMLRVGEFRA